MWTSTGSLAELWAAVKQFTARNYKLVGVILLIKGLGDWISGGQFWYGIGVHIVPSILHFYGTWYGRLLTAVCGAGLIFIPWRKLFHLGRSYDLAILRDRTLKLRDEIQDFLDGLGPMPQDQTTGTLQVRAGPDWRSPDGIMHDSAIVRATGPMSQRIAKVDYGYELYFAAPARRIYNEFGFRGVMDDQMKELLFKSQQYNREFALRDMIQALSRLAELKEATDPD